MRRRSSALPLLCLSVLMAAGGVGCAGFGFRRDSAAPGRAGPETAAEPMDMHRLERIFADQVDAITGSAGALQTQIDGTPVYCLSDPDADRMQILAPVVRVAGLDPRVFEVLLQANFQSTLDARYAIADDVVFAAFLHPISSLSPAMIRSSLSQVMSLVKTFGSSYSAQEFVLPDREGSGFEQE